MKTVKPTKTSSKDSAHQYENLDEDESNRLRQKEYLSCSMLSYVLFSWVTDYVNVKQFSLFARNSDI